MQQHIALLDQLRDVLHLFEDGLESLWYAFQDTGHLHEVFGHVELLQKQAESMSAAPTCISDCDIKRMRQCLYSHSADMHANASNTQRLPSKLLLDMFAIGSLTATCIHTMEANVAY